MDKRKKSIQYKNVLHRKSTMLITICIQIVILLTLFISLKISESKEPVTIDAPLEKWSSGYISYIDGWYIDETLCQTNSTIDMLCGPHVFLPKGYYTLKIWYECDNNQSFKPYVVGDQYFYLRSATGVLDKHRTYETYSFQAKEDIENFEVQIKYNGVGSLKINNIEIVSNCTGLKLAFFSFLSFFLIIDFVWVNFRKLFPYKKIICSLIGIIFLTSLPVMMLGINYGHDLQFHLLRIEGIANELRAGCLPVRLSSSWMAGYGYPVSVFYGDVFLYFPALLRIVGFTIDSAYKAYLVLINMLTVIISYHSFKRIFKRYDIALATTIAYSLSTYRMMNIYIRSAVGEYSASAFIPLIALAIFNIYTQNEKNWEKYVKNSLILAVGMTGIIQTHILTTEMVVFFLVLICVLLFKKTMRSNTLKVYILAVLETILFNVWFLVPFLDYYLNVPVVINDSVAGNLPKLIQYGGAYILQYFSFLQSPFGGNNTLINGRMSMTPGFLLMVVLILSIILIINGKADNKIKLLTLLSLIALLIASNLFPWDYLATNYKFGNILAQVQFPWRYIGLATIFLTMLLGMLLNASVNFMSLQEIRKIFISIFIIGFLSASVFASSYCNGTSCALYYDSPELDEFGIMGGEYLRVPRKDIRSLSANVTAENINALKILSREGSDMKLYCETGSEEGKLILPLLNYKGYQVKDSNNNLYKIIDGPNCEIAVTIPANYSGNISVSFVSPWYWRVAELISLLFTILVGGYILRKNKCNSSRYNT